MKERKGNAAARRPLDESGPGARNDPELSVRKAALLLHGLGTADREWLLEQVGSRERTVLSELLQELDLLGIPTDPALVAEVVGDVREKGPGTRGVIPADPREARVLAARPESLAALLREEPASLAARLIRLREWPWKDEVLRRLGPARAEQVAALVAATDRTVDPSSETRLADRLLERIAERLEEVSAGGGRQVQGAGRKGSLLRGALRLLGASAR